MISNDASYLFFFISLPALTSFFHTITEIERTDWFTLEGCLLPWRGQGHIQCVSLLVHVDVYRNMSVDLRLGGVEIKVYDAAFGGLK